MRRLLIGLFLVVITASCSVQVGATATESLTNELAKQLMSGDWGLVSYSKSPVVVYNLKFVEVDEHHSQDLALSFLASTDVEQGEWSVATDEAIVRYAHSASINLSHSFSGGNEQVSNYLAYESWLFALADEPVEINIQEDFVGGNENRENAVFTVRISPKQLDLNKQQLLTRVELDLLSQDGAMGKADITAWLNPEAVPIAVVGKQVTGSRNKKYKYFAMYVQANLLFLEQIPDDLAVIPMGSIAGMQQLFRAEKPEVIRPSEWQVFLTTGDGLDLGMEFSTSIQQRHELYGSMQFSNEELVYTLGAIGRIYEKLGFIAQLERNLDGTLPLLRLGLSDETILGGKLYLKASYFPMVVNFEEASVERDNHLKFKAIVKNQGWALWYQGLWKFSGLDSQVGVSTTPESTMGLDVSWLRTHDGNNRFLVGFVVRRF